MYNSKNYSFLNNFFILIFNFLRQKFSCMAYKEDIKEFVYVFNYISKNIMNNYKFRRICCLQIN